MEQFGIKHGKHVDPFELDPTTMCVEDHEDELVHPPPPIPPSRHLHLQPLTPPSGPQTPTLKATPHLATMHSNVPCDPPCRGRLQLNPTFKDD